MIVGFQGNPKPKIEEWRLGLGKTRLFFDNWMVLMIQGSGLRVLVIRSGWGGGAPMSLGAKRSGVHFFACSFNGGLGC